MVKVYTSTTLEGKEKKKIIKEVLFFFFLHCKTEVRTLRGLKEYIGGRWGEGGGPIRPENHFARS